MQMIQCPNCGKLTGFKRALGFGTFFMVLLTCGLWLLVIPFYPMRCINCGLTRGSAFAHNFATWYRGLSPGGKAFVLLPPALLFLGIAMFNSFHNSGTPHNPPVTYPTNYTYTGNASDANNDNPAAAPVVYSVAQINAHMNNIPTGTELAVRGIYVSPHVSGGWAPPNELDPCSVLLYGGTVRVQHGEADPRDYCRFSVVVQDENTSQIQYLECEMGLEEAQAAKGLYGFKSLVQAHGTYASSLDFQVMPMFLEHKVGVPVLENCSLTPLATPVPRIRFRDLGDASTAPAPQPAPAAVAERPTEGSTQDSEVDVLYQENRYSEALPLLDQGCTAGNGLACTRLGVYYEKGLGVAQDLPRAAELFSKSCNEGNAKGCFNFGISYKSGKGVKQDYPRAAALFSQSCNGGYAEGCDVLAIMNALGIGLAKDASRAAALYSRACDGGSIDGCTNLGIDYMTGNGVGRDDSRAATLLSKGCDGGDADGCSSLGSLYYVGRGVAADHSRAAALYSKACDGGDADGCSLLGLLYSAGDGVQQDSEKARQLANKGCSMGDKSGCDELKQIR